MIYCHGVEASNPLGYTNALVQVESTMIFFFFFIFFPAPLPLIFFLKELFCVYGCLDCMYVCVPHVVRTEVTDGYCAPCGFWEPDLGPLKDQ